MSTLRLTSLVLALYLLAPLLAEELRFPGGGWVALADDDDDDDDDDDRPAPRPPSPPPPREVVAAGLTRAQIATLQGRGYQVLGERGNGLVGQPLLLLRAPAGQRRDPLAEVRALGRNVLADRNHLYRHQQGQPPQDLTPLAQVDWPVRAQRCRVGAPIGLIDTRVDLDHPALRGASVRILNLPGRDARAASHPEHGTAIAALLVGQDRKLPALVPRARLIAVDAFQPGPRGDTRMQAWDLLAALDALVDAGAGVINMSFAGQPNLLLARTLEQVHARGVVTVAAMGNRGPRAAPQYPAAYPGVIAVTAVGMDGRVYARAGRGRHVDFSAPGVNLPVALGNGQSGVRSGTSFAAPFVTAAAAMAQGQRPQPRTVDAVQQRLVEHTRDLGSRGHDAIYGHGLLQASRLCPG